ncbi:tetratricopeptide repeat protein [candidate division KSB1 bacterium]
MKKFLLLSILAGLFMVQCTASKYAAGDRLLTNGNYDSAIEEFRALTEADPSDYRAHIKLGDAYFARKDFTEAINAYAAALEIQPGNSDAQEKWMNASYEKAQLLINDGEHGPAIRIFEVILEKNPDYSRVLKPLAQAYRELNRLDKARELFSLRLSRNPDDAEAAEALEEIGSTESEAVKLYLSAHKDYNAGMYYEASETLQKALELKRDYKEALYLRHLAEGRHHLRRSSESEMWEAIKAFGLAVSAKPEEIEAYFYMAQAFEKKDKDDFKTPIEMYEKVVGLSPDSEFGKESQKKVKELTEKKKKMEEFLKKKKGGIIN